MKNGFSLVELSIVLVILGLLIGGVLTGQNLIKAAELRSVTEEYKNYQTAVNIFRDKYLAMPGDMINAGKFWGYANTGGAGGICAAPATNTGTSPLTCDGNGSGSLDQQYEMFRFWQHLANAGLIEGQYTGVTGGGGAAHHVPGTNSPRSKLSPGSWAIGYIGVHAGNATTFAHNYGHMGYYGAPTTTSAPTTALLAPEDVWNIDMKMDDGMPGAGNLIVYPWTTCSLAASQTDYAAAYKLTSTTKDCILYFASMIR